MEPVAIKLKRKYLTGFRSSQKSASNHGGVSKHTKISQKAKDALPKQPKKILHLTYIGRNGRARMETIG